MFTPISRGKLSKEARNFITKREKRRKRISDRNEENKLWKQERSKREEKQDVFENLISRNLSKKMKIDVMSLSELS